VPTPPSALIREHVWANAIVLLPIMPQHLDVLHDLPYHHKDPFDSLMVAQAVREEMTLIIKDQALGAYDVRTAWSSE
jgi:PIN domain nuclease of toxin-antitoxin system